ncbi:hypothetical protein ACMHYB_01595 [Sorangium sp. So ce1128]
MPITSLIANPNEHGWKGEQKLLSFGHYSLVLLWEVDLLLIHGELQLRSTALGEQLKQPPPMKGEAMLKLSGSWDGVGSAEVTVTFKSEDRTLTIDGKVTYSGNGPMVTTSVHEVIKL